ncbi:hypothetical protein Q7P35_005537 [Cladosporium inversicolor]
MTHSLGWVKLPKLVDEDDCTAAAEDSLKFGLKSTPRCRDVMRMALMSHGNTINEKVELLKPGAKLCGQAIGRFLPNPTLASSSHVLLYIALTMLDKSNGMFSLTLPEQASITASHTQEEITLAPGDGLLWRGDCERRGGGGHGGIVLILQYD